jgi:hypothetical protein
MSGKFISSREVDREEAGWGSLAWFSSPRLVKKLERAEDKEDPSGAPVSVCDRDGESAASAAE